MLIIFLTVKLFVMFLDLKKLIRFESNPQVGTSSAAGRRPIQAVSHSVNIQRLFESHTRNNTQNKKHPERQNSNAEASARKETNNDDNNQEKNTTEQQKVVNQKKNQPKTATNDKENLPAKTTADNLAPPEAEPKTKMWIRPKSAQTTRSANIKKRTDPVALYSAYQKDWAKFQSNICETSRSELRWQIREKLARK